MDYCNSLLFGMTDDLFKRLQGIQNAAARLVTSTGRREHMTPVLCQLHWAAGQATRRVQAGVADS